MDNLNTPIRLDNAEKLKVIQHYIQESKVAMQNAYLQLSDMDDELRMEVNKNIKTASEELNMILIASKLQYQKK